MAERRSNRQRKPILHFDDIVRQSAKPAKTRKPRTKALEAFEAHHDSAPAESSNNEAIQEDPIVRKIFGEIARMELEIPCFINDYNHHMNSVDLANQFREAYDTQQIAYRTWIP